MGTDGGVRVLDRLPVRLRLWKLRSWLWRFRTLPFARRAFAERGGSLVLGRRFAGGTLALEVGRTDTHRLLYLEGDRFVPERRILGRLATPGATVVDVGANIGYIALILARSIGPDGRLVCLEPIPDNLRELRRNVEINQLRQVEILPIAAGDASGQVGMTLGLNGVVAGTGGDLEVEIRRLDGLGLEKVDLIKIDVEGYERPVLAGASGLLRSRRPTIFVEIHPRLTPNPEDAERIVDDLHGFGYRELEAFRPTVSRSLLRKFCSRYLGALTLDRTSDPMLWIEEAMRGGTGDPFWLVAGGFGMPPASKSTGAMKKMGPGGAGSEA